MFDYNDPSLVVQMCKFEAFIQKSHIVIKFPCSYFVEWKTINNRYSICTQKKVRTANDEAIFNQKLTFYTEMIYNTKKREYHSKETFLVLNLVSKSRPDQVKLVGRISVDLAQVLNKKRFSEVTQMQLNYCSVEGSIVFSVCLLNKRDSNLSVKDLDRSAFTDYFSLNPINRMIPEEPAYGVFGTKNNLSQSPQKGYYNGYSQQHTNLNNNQGQLIQSANKIPTFAAVTSSPQQPYPKRQLEQQFIRVKKDQEIMSFQNSQKKAENHHYHSLLTDSREQSLIQKLEEKNLGVYQQKWTDREKRNVVEVERKQSRTYRHFTQNIQENTQNGVKLQSKNRTQILNQTQQQQIQSGQIKRQPGVQKVPSQSNLPSSSSKVYIPSVSLQAVYSGQSKPFSPLAKPTSPASYSRQLSHKISQSQLSESSQYQNEQILGIVEKLQRQKREQQLMIEQLKAMAVEKIMRKKERKSATFIEESEQLNKIKVLSQDNRMMKEQMEGLRETLRLKNDEVRQKELHVFELFDKISRLQNQLIYSQGKIEEYQREIEYLNKKQAEYKQICESMRLSASMQPSQFALRLTQLEAEIPIQLSKSSKLLDVIKPPQLSSSQISRISLKQYRGQSYYPQEQRQLQPQHQTQHQLQLQSQGEQFQIRINRDENIYEELQLENVQLSQKIKQLQQQNASYKQLIQQHHTQLQHKNSPNSPIFSKSQTVISPLQETQHPFTITISKNNNVYENYENLQQENDELYDRYKILEKELQSYKDLLKETNYPENIKEIQCNQCSPVNIKAHHDEEQLFTYPVSIGNIDNRDNFQKSLLFNTGKQLLSGMYSKSPSYGQQHQKQQLSPLNPMELVSEAFKIILTKDKKIYQEQQEDNLQLSKRVIQLQQQVEKYRELLKSEHQLPPTYPQGMKSSMSSLEKQDHYETQGFTITLSKDNNIFENQQKQLTELQTEIKILQQTLNKYQSLYGPLNKEPQVKISITRDSTIYEEQQKQIKDLLKLLQTKDQEVIQLTTKISLLEIQLQEEKPSINGQIKINIKRDDNIYDEQERQINDLTKILQEKDYEIQSLKGKLSTLDTQLQSLRPSNNGNIKINIMRDENIYEEQQSQIKDLLKTLQNKDDEILELTRKISILQNQLEEQRPSKNGQIKISIKRDDNIYDQQQRQITDLLKTLQTNEDDAVLMTKRVSLLQKQIQESRPSSSGEIKISIKRDDEIYEEQEKEIRELSKRVIELQEQIQYLKEQMKLNELQMQSRKEVVTIKSLNHLSQLANNFRQPLRPICTKCAQFQLKVDQLQMNINLLQQQKCMLEQEVGSLGEENFCLNSTENQLKIKIEELEQEIEMIQQENQRLSEELYFLQQNHNLQNHQHQQGQDGSENYQEEAEKQEGVQQLTEHEHVIFTHIEQQNLNINLNLSNNKFNTFPHQLNNSHTPSANNLNSLQNLNSVQNSHHSINNIIPYSSHNSKQNNLPQSSSSDKQPPVIIMLQQQNSELRQSLTIFQQQLEQQQLTIGALQHRISKLMHQKEILYERDQSMSKEISEIRQKLLQQRDKEYQTKTKQSQLQKQLSQTRGKSSHIDTVLSNSRVTENQLAKKQQQIEHLEQELRLLNNSLTELSTSYQSLQETFAQLEREKQVQVDSIREEHENMNNHLKNQLQEIQNIIVEKQKRCEENQEQLRARGEEIEALVDQLNELRQENNVLLGEKKRLIELRQQNGDRQGKSTEDKNLMRQTIESLKGIKSGREMHTSSLLPLISRKVDESPFPQQSTLANLIIKQIQKIKLDIMRNQQSQSTSRPLQRSNEKTPSNNLQKPVTEKSQILNYLKTLEDLLQGY